MNLAQRRELARQVLAGYANGPDAPIRATASALAKLGNASTVVIVEGVSDQIAVETAAAMRSRDLDAERVAIVPIGGAHAIARFLTSLRPNENSVRLAGLCDRREEAVYERGLAMAGVASPRTRADLERLGFFVCVDDLEDELLRAVGVARTVALFDEVGDLESFRSLQAQPAWRGRPIEAQLRRFMTSGARRKSRYAHLLVEAADGLGVLPHPLEALLAAI